MVIAIAAQALVACGGSSLSAGLTSTRQAPAATSGPSRTFPLLAEDGSHVRGVATVTPADDPFTVRVHASGLQAGLTHPAHIHAGTCGSNGAIVYPLHDLVPDRRGDATSTTKISHPYRVPEGGWFINVHRGPTLAGAGETPVACANLGG